MHWVSSTVYPLRKGIHVEEPQGGELLAHAAATQLSGFEQISGVLADLFQSKLMGCTVEISREFLHAPQVGAHGAFGLVRAHELIGRPLQQTYRVR